MKGSNEFIIHLDSEKNMHMESENVEEIFKGIKRNKKEIKAYEDEKIS